MELKSKEWKEKLGLARPNSGDFASTTPAKANVSKLFGRYILNILLQVDEGEEGEPLDSDEDSISSNNKDLNHRDDESKSSSEDNNFHLEEMRKYSLPWFTEDDSSTSGWQWTAGENEGFCWSSKGSLPPPAMISQRGKSRVKPDWRGSCFKSPLSSFFTFTPLKMFRVICMYSNAYAHAAMARTRKQEISGAPWASNITLTEMMKSFGLLLHMVMRPALGTSYPHCWTDLAWHPYTVHMALRCSLILLRHDLFQNF